MTSKDTIANLQDSYIDWTHDAVTDTHVPFTHVAIAANAFEHMQRGACMLRMAAPAAPGLHSKRNAIDSGQSIC